ncbi:sigma-70 family RNA polymerase sigma factor [Actinomycetospora sp. CA-101289]|uniref:sigma-70 family RNA polymerase sigma factor n=1 Tax=Actinomycetospora sp. CA-101289 TaxID=3239893 RepID=UPI003D95991F
MTADEHGHPGPDPSRGAPGGGGPGGDDPRSDGELIARLRGRGADPDSTAAFATLYARHHQAARALARQLARSPADADDLVAGAFTRMLEVLRAGRGPTEAFRAYLLTSVRHLAYDRTRAERRLDLTDDLTGVHGVDPDGTVVPFTDPALAGLERTLAARAFATLPERWQAVLWHLEVEGDSPADIAPLFGLTPNAVSALGYRAREGLRQAYLQEHLAAGSGRWDRRHRDTGERLGAYTRGGLSRRDAQRVEAHLAECAECRALADELREVNSGMVRAVVAPLVLGAGLMGYLASRGGTGTFALDATTGELAVAGGGALGVLGALTGLGGITGVTGAVRPAVTGRLGPVGVVGLAGAVGLGAFVLGDALEPAPVPLLPPSAAPAPGAALPAPPPLLALPALPPLALPPLVLSDPALDVPGLGAAAGTDAGREQGTGDGDASRRGVATRSDGEQDGGGATTRARTAANRTPDRTPDRAAAREDRSDRRGAPDCALTVRLPVVGAAGALCSTGPR